MNNLLRILLVQIVLMLLIKIEPGIEQLNMVLILLLAGTIIETLYRFGNKKDTL